jgi:hypothetical protein
MNDLRLTIGIPTLGARPDRLQKAIGAALGQSIPARVLVSLQGDAPAATDAIEPFLSHPLVRLVRSPASCLWENWTHAAEMCDTEIFAWLQDDDILSPHFARRVLAALDRHPRAVAWIARLGISFTDGASLWWQATGPMVPMDLISGGLTEIDGLLLAAGSFFSSFALSPGVAFRVTPETIAAVNRVPKDSDLFAERTVLAELGTLGAVVCDPAIVGYWCQHESNESRRQVLAGESIRQFERMCEAVDPILAARPDWTQALHGWSCIVGREVCDRWLADTDRFLPGTDALRTAREVVSGAAGRAHSQAEEPQPVETTVAKKPRRAERAVKVRA